MIFLFMFYGYGCHGRILAEMASGWFGPVQRSKTRSIDD